jgi:alkyldihydroxyacetonephosphate synthase
MSTWAPPPPLRWWGWGERETPLSDAFLGLLSGEVGLPADPPRRVGLDEVTLLRPHLSAGLRTRLAAVVGEDHVDASKEARVRHAAGRSYIDLLTLRSGRLTAAPDAVVSPASETEIIELLRVCADTSIAVVPFGGGTSVVGGVAPLSGDHRGVISLDLHRLDSISGIDIVSATARLGAGLRGPAVERRLAAHGLALDHIPQSFEYATIGGYAATRSAGQASTGVGRFDELALGLRCVAPAGVVVAAPHPASAAGPELRELLLGSEGTLGVITEVTAQLRRLPARRRYEGFVVPDFAAGVDALRSLGQAGMAPDVCRLSDEEETRISLAASDHGGGTSRALDAYLRARRRRDGCLVIVGAEGDGASVGFRLRRAAEALRDHGGVALGRVAGSAWRHSRFSGPYLRDALLDAGVMVETLETATTWSGLMTLRHRVVDALVGALAGSGTPARVGCHVSHVYPSGASLYVTVMARMAADPAEQWLRAKRAASEAIVAAGATITHHHGVGLDHAPWMGAEVGDTGVAILRAVKQQLDPAGIMNPGKLLAVEQRVRARRA